MTNADKFKSLFGIYATELWAMSEKEFLEWLNSEVSNRSEIPNSWIPCSERLPEEEEDVLVARTFLGCIDGSHGWNNHIPPKTYVEVAQYFNGEWTALSDEYKVARSRHTDPIAWQPLPSPYQPEEKTE